MRNQSQRMICGRPQCSDTHLYVDDSVFNCVIDLGGNSQSRPTKTRRLVTHNELDDVDGSSLAYTVATIDGLIFNGDVPPEE